MIHKKMKQSVTQNWDKKKFFKSEIVNSKSEIFIKNSGNTVANGMWIVIMKFQVTQILTKNFNLEIELQIQSPWAPKPIVN